MDEGRKDFSSVDGWIDLIKDTTSVLFALTAAIAAMVGIDVNQFFWILVLLGGTIVYSVFLPYKRAILIKGEWGAIARAHTARTIIMAIPAWGILSYLLIINGNLSSHIREYVLSEPVDEVSRLIIFIMFALLISGSIAISYKFENMLRDMGFQEERTKAISGYFRSRGYRDAFSITFLVFYAIGFVTSGWFERENLNLSIEYFSYGMVYLFVIILYGFFSAWYIPERYVSNKRYFFEILLTLAILVSNTNPPISAVVISALILVLTVKTMQSPEINIDMILEKEERDLSEFRETRTYQYSSKHLGGYVAPMNTIFEAHSKSIRLYFGLVIAVMLVTVLYNPLLAVGFAYAMLFLFFFVMILKIRRVEKQVT